MSTILSIYTKNAYEEYLLPAEADANVAVAIKRKKFLILEDLVLRFENIRNNWFILEDEYYSFRFKNNKEDNSLSDGDVISVRTLNDEVISVVVKIADNSFSVYKKYDLDSVNSFMIGSDPSNDVIFNAPLVSKSHAMIVRSEQGFMINDGSTNGTFVNGKRIKQSKILKTGDVISIFGLSMVFLNDVIAIKVIDDGKCIVRTLQEVGQVYEECDSPAQRKKKYFHRSPRINKRIPDEPIEIESPPSPKEENRKPLWMVIGPSFTMMIPMLLGTLFTIYAMGGENAANTMRFRMFGLVTAGGSAIIGIFWALTNLRYYNKQIKEGEKLRFKAYGDYLVECAEEVHQKYEDTISILNERYKDLDTVTKYGEDNEELWNRNATHDDFLKQRLGIGNTPFQVQIRVPKEKFTLLPDDLAKRPKLIKDEYSTLLDVPILVDFLEHKLIGLVGGEGKAGAYPIIRSLSTQIAASNCYTEVKLVYLYDDMKDDENWEYAKWLPHVWSEDKKTRYVASSKKEVGEVLYELTSALRMREENEGFRKSEKIIPRPYYILIVSDLELLEGELITKYMYDDNPMYGLSTIIMAERRDQLPNECEFIIENDNSYNGIYNLKTGDGVNINFDTITNGELERFARKLASIEVRENEKGRDIPNALDFFDMLEVSDFDELCVEDRWRKNRTYDNMRAIIGAKAGGQPCYLDVHEKYHGPHGLVAGTTGSGKSETLQTYILSMAINFSPDDVGFFIIDYKGGGMAGLFDGMPHMIGSISNLSGNQVRRAMVSIKSENRRRQKIFTDNNVNNINLYTKLVKNGEAKLPVPHMFIIIDEFAELKREEPEFMKELISVAQVGRSLGVHLILATQKPSGTVDDNIWSNSKFKLCLRVQDKQDSNDMLHKPDAAYITQAGRGYLQVGNDEVYELFQSGYSGATYEGGREKTKTDIATMISTDGKASIVGNSIKTKQKEKARNQWILKLLEIIDFTVAKSGLSFDEFVSESGNISKIFENIEKRGIDFACTDFNVQRIEDLLYTYAYTRKGGIESGETIASMIIKNANFLKKKLPEKKNKTQLDAIIEYLAEVAKKEHYDHQMQLWMPLLPEALYLDSLDGYSVGTFNGTEWTKKHNGWSISTQIGLGDDPVNQNQMPVSIDFAQQGHLAICGSVVSGKSTFLQTLLFALINKYNPDWLNIYAIDFSSRMLLGLETAPHVGGIMFEDDFEKIDKFFRLIDSIIDERKKLFRGGNYSQYVQANGVTLPTILIAVDNIGSFREKTENKYDDKLVRIAKEGISYGIFLAVAALGFSSAEINTKLGDNIQNAIGLQLVDKYAYVDCLKTNKIDVIPENGIKGRGLAKHEGRILEFQTALSIEAENDFQRNEKIKDICNQMSAAWTGKRARSIPVIPEKPIWTEFEQLSGVMDLKTNQHLIPVGYDMDSADIYSIDLSKAYVFTISGRTRTGKTNMLKNVVASLSGKAGKKIVMEIGSRELKLVADNTGAEYMDTQEQIAKFFADILPVFKERNVNKAKLIEKGLEDSDIFVEQSSYEPYYIVIADLVEFVKTVYNKKEGVVDIHGFVENVAEKGKLHNIFFIAGVNPEKAKEVLGMRTFEGMTGYKTGIHLGGSLANIRYLDFSNFGYQEQNKVQKAGIGAIPLGNDDDVTKKVVVPLYR